MDSYNEQTYSGAMGWEKLLAVEDLLWLLADSITARSTLRNLCLASRRLNEIFSRVLYSHLVFDAGNVHFLREPELLGRLIGNLRLQHVRKLSFKVSEGSWEVGGVPMMPELMDMQTYGLAGDTRWWSWPYNKAIMAVLERAPRLEAFEWRNWPLSEELSQALGSNFPRLKEVSIRYADISAVTTTDRLYERGQRRDFDQHRSSLLSLSIPAGLTNLRKLELYDITSADLDGCAASIVQVLSRSPGLRELGLSLSVACENMHFGRSQGPERARSFLGFFVGLVEKYREEADARPLRLHTLKLGYGVLLADNLEQTVTPTEPLIPEPVAVDVISPAAYLCDLTDPSALEELYMDNDHDVGASVYGDAPSASIAWPSINPDIMPNLRRLTLSRLTGRSCDWLFRPLDPSFVAGLDLAVGSDKETYSSSSSSGTSFASMLFPHTSPEARVRAEGAQSPSPGSHTRLFRQPTFLLRPHAELPGLPARCTRLTLLNCDWQATRSDVLRSATWVRTLTVSLWKWAEPASAADLLAAAAPPRLDNLWIRVGMDWPALRSPGRCYPDGGPPLMMLFGGGVDDVEEFLTLGDEQPVMFDRWREKWAAMARAVAASPACPRRYLKVGHSAWRVHPEREGEQQDGGAVRLEPLDYWEDEAEGPEVFRFNQPNDK